MGEPEFTQTETLLESAESRIVRAIRRTDGAPFLLKILQGGGGQPLRRLQKENEIGGSLDRRSILFPVALSNVDDHPALVLEDFDGHPLERELGHRMELEVALEIGTALATRLGEIHARGVVHRDLKPQNVFVDPRTGEVRLTGLGVALSSGGAYRASSEPALIEGTFAYMAPEQTGQTGRVVDKRADLYSLGVVLYRMLTGALPFEARDPLGWIHLHVAKRPPLATGIPPLVAAIVDKLLAKDPEERYQTAGGLVADLSQCLSSWRATKKIRPFVLGLRDVPDHLQIPRRLHGRNAEVATLTRAFERTAAGATEVVLARGPAGIGKSSVAKAIESRVVARGGIYLEGKYDELRRDVPYFAFGQALDQLAGRLLTESEPKLAAWRAKFHGSLGANVALLTSLAPRFRLVLGEGAPKDLGTALESPDRFRLFFHRLLGAIASEDHPLVLFLDDLQWADPSSLALVEHATIWPGHILTIGAYRDDEVPEDHVLSRVRKHTDVAEIALAGLPVPAIAQLIVDAFRCPMPEATTLAQVLRDRAGGNPLFVTELLRTLQQRGLIQFDRAIGKWRWDIAQIRLVPLADEAVDLLLAKIGDLAASQKEALQVGACLGIEFRIADVAAVLDRSADAIERDLALVSHEGLLLYGDDAFRFPHDRVREAVYSLVERDDRPQLHLRIGRSLAAHDAAEERVDRAFLLADQLNRASSLMTSRAERERLAELDLAVGRRAKTASAHASAAQYFGAGIALLGGEAWKDAYAISYGLHLELAKCKLVLGRGDEAERLLETVLSHAKSAAEQAPAYSVLVDLRMAQSDIPGAIEIGLTGLRACGVDVPEKPTAEELMSTIGEVLELLGDRPIEKLLELPRATDETARAAADLLAHVGGPAVYYNENFLPMLVSKGVVLGLQSGLSESAPSILVTFGTVLGAISGRYDECWRLGRIAYDLVREGQLSAQKPLVCLVFASLANYWKQHVRTDLPYLEECREAAHQLGDLTYVCYAENHIVMTRLIMGADLAKLEVESAERMQRVREFDFGELADLMWSRHLLIQLLRGVHADLDDFGATLRATRRALTVSWHLVHTLQGEFVLGHLERAIAAGREAIPLLHTSAMFPIVGEHAFYYALALASTAPLSNEDLHEFDGYRQKLADWARHCPENFAHKHALVAAEAARMRGDDLVAMREYERAIRSAQDNGFVQVQATAYELAARFYRVRGFSHFASVYIREARRCFALWGATAKVRQLDERGPLLELPSSETVATNAVELDMLTVTQTSQALSAELVRDKLLDRLLALMLRYAGARRCSFLAVQAERATVEAEALGPGAPPGAPLPEAVINYARRTRERVLLQDALAPNPFSSDPYLQTQRPRSVLCLPVSRQETLLGLIYLENDLAPGVFSAERVTVLEVLAAQAAISLESAELFGNLERENTQRRRAEASLRASREQLRAILENMVDAVFVCDESGNVTLVNQAALRLLGLESRAEAQTTTVELARAIRLRRADGKLFDPAELPLSRALRGEIVTSIDVTLTSRHERDVHLRVSAAPIEDEDGKVVGAVAAASDVTEKVELDRLRDEFLRMAAHELKTPVAVVSGYAELLQMRELVPPGQERMLEALIRGAHRIDRIVSDLLFLWQLRMGRLVLIDESVELGALLARAASRLEPTPRAPRVHIDSKGPVTVIGDRMLLEKVFTHLIDNALRYSPGGELVEVVLRERPEGGADIVVNDLGIGVPLEKQSRLFEPFYRAHADTAYDFGGLGVGLYLSRVIMSRHGGTLRFESRESGGSVLRASLPRRPSEENDVLRRAAPSA